jgi:putative DNA primase/helicase
MTNTVNLLSSGLALVKIPKGSKAPETYGWNKRENVITSHDQIKFLGDFNIGLAHAYCLPSPTCAIDIDNLFDAREWLRRYNIDLDLLLNAPDAVSIFSGKSNSAKLIYRLPSDLVPLKTKMIRNNEGKSMLEFRCASSDGLTVQDVIPPSIHPSGTLYQWGGKGSILAIPTIPHMLLDLWQSLIKSPAKINQNNHVQPLESPREVARVQLALTYISADCDYETYRNVVWALLSTGWTNAIDLAKNWCMSCIEQYKEHGFDVLVESYDPVREQRISLGTLFKLAKEGGFNA